MAKFKIVTTEMVGRTYEVEADNEDHARERFEQGEAKQIDIECSEWDIEEIEEVIA